MDPIIGGALIGAGAKLVGGILGHSAQRDYNKTQLQIAREQMAYNEKMWNAENAYNDPSAQMQRLKNAGLNPNLVYGQSVAGAAGNASGHPEAVKPDIMPYTALSDSVSSMGDNAMQAAIARQQIDVSKQQAASATTTAQASMINALSHKSKSDTEVGILEATKNDVIEQYRVRTKLMQLGYDYDRATYDARLQTVTQNLSNLVQQNSLMKSNANKIEAEINEIMSRQTLNFANAFKARVEADILNRSADTIVETHQNVAAKGRFEANFNTKLNEFYDETVNNPAYFDQLKRTYLSCIRSNGVDWAKFKYEMDKYTENKIWSLFGGLGTAATVAAFH